MFSGIFLNNSRFRGRLKVVYYIAKSIFARRTWRTTGGTCIVCGEKSHFYTFYVGFNQYGVDPADETGFCWQCGAQNRNRALALVILTNYFGSRFANIKSTVGSEKQKIFIAAANGALPCNLSHHINIAFSEYFEDTPPGEFRGNTLCQDLTNLSFDDVSLDLIVSEHVLEHVNDPLKAFLEIHRVLKPGGMTIFTIPFEAKNTSITRLTPDMIEIESKKYHKDPLRNDGSLVFTDFAKEDFVERFLRPAGLIGEILSICDSTHCVSNSIVVVARKNDVD